MRITHLELRNYRRFKELKLDFPDGVTGILGLNGSGKSTVVESIAWALFGNIDETVRTGKDSVKRTGTEPDEPCSATLEFELNGVEYRIEREMRGKNLTAKATLRTRSGVIASSDTDATRMVQKLIGMDYKSFYTSVFARQGDLSALQDAQPAERRRAVLSMLRIDRIDEIIKLVREDFRDVKKRIEWAEKQLVDEDGRDKDKVIMAKLPGLESAKKDADDRHAVAEDREKKAQVEADRARARRDELRKDSEAYSTAKTELGSKRAQLNAVKERRAKTSKRIGEVEEKLARMPELEKAEAQFKEVGARKELMDSVKAKADAAAHLEKDIADMNKELEGYSTKRDALAKDLEKTPDPGQELESIQAKREENSSEKARLSSAVGELRAVVQEKRKGSEKDRKKLEELGAVGREGLCPTCEKALGDAYELLINKLNESVAIARDDIDRAEKEMVRLNAEIHALDKRDEALGKKREGLEKQAATRRRLEVSVEETDKNVDRVEARIKEKTARLQEFGKIDYSEKEHGVVKAELDRLRPLHDDYVRTKESEKELGRLKNDLSEATEQEGRISSEESVLNGVLEKLEPRKNEYEKAYVEYDQKALALNAAKDERHRLSAARERANNELSLAKDELERIAKTKQAIGDDRHSLEDLGALEDTLLGFRDNLISRVAPALSEATASLLTTMSGGRYSKVALTEDYELQVEDQGGVFELGRFSGGESDIANLAFRLAVSRIIAERAGANPVNFLILDEIFGSLDPNRRRSVMQALSALSSQFRQIFLITHVEEVKDMMGSVVVIEELEEGTSVARPA